MKAKYDSKPSMYESLFLTILLFCSTPITQLLGSRSQCKLTEGGPWPMVSLANLDCCFLNFL